jgi:hypothetical protein
MNAWYLLKSGQCPLKIVVMDSKGENLSLIALDSNPRTLQSNSITFNHVCGHLLLIPQ